MSLGYYFEIVLLPIAVIAFVTEFTDAAFGMGFGTILAPILLILGFNAHDIVPPMLLAQLVAGLVVSLTHVLLKNVKLGKKNFHYVLFNSRKKRLELILAPLFLEINTKKKLQEASYEDSQKHTVPDVIEADLETIEEKRMEVEIDSKRGEVNHKNMKLRSKIQNMTRDSKTVLILSSFAITGVIIAAIISVVFQLNETFQFGANLYIATMVLIMGIIMLVYQDGKSSFSWSRIISLGALAGFNKGLSGGGFGPIMVVAQVVSGRNGKNAIASTLIAETAASTMAIVTYLITNIIFYTQSNEPISWGWMRLAPYMIIGATLAAPIAALVTKKINEKKLRITSGIIMIILSLFTMIRLILIYSGVWSGVPTFV